TPRGHRVAVQLCGAAPPAQPDVRLPGRRRARRPRRRRARRDEPGGRRALRHAHRDATHRRLRTDERRWHRARLPAGCARAGVRMTRSHLLPRDAAAIGGIGQTEFSRDAGRTELQLASEAVVAACADAQIDVGDIDGLVSYTIEPVEETELVRTAGLQEVGYSARVPYGGG